MSKIEPITRIPNVPIFIGADIRAMRKQMKMTQRALSRALGYTDHVMWNYEHDTNVMDTRGALAFLELYMSKTSPLAESRQVTSTLAA